MLFGLAMPCSQVVHSALMSVSRIAGNLADRQVLLSDCRDCHEQRRVCIKFPSAIWRQLTALSMIANLSLPLAFALITMADFAYERHVRHC